MTPIRTETHTLVCQLTTEERIQRGLDLGAAVEEIQSLRTQRSDYLELIDAQIKIACVRRDQIIATSKAAREIRDVVCEVSADLERQAFVTTRTDTAEIIDRRQMTSEEIKAQVATMLDSEPPPPPAAPVESVTTIEPAEYDAPAYTQSNMVATELSEEALAKAAKVISEIEFTPPSHTFSVEPADSFDSDDGALEWLLSTGSLGQQLDWLREHGYPVPVGAGRKDRTRAMLSALQLGAIADDLDAAYAPLKWPAPADEVTCPECGSATPEDCEHELP